ncbi:cation diffusion facilitator family transporter [Lacipirellula sp.]|uniref:cation diffusion facilitator family transporter n=1 Tax=Lacipirellula sp. TaxID=2691419 RepID=UPI003D0D8052
MHDHPHPAGKNLRFAFFVNFVFTFIEIAGGIWTGSVAILSDAVHDAGDCISLGLAWYLQGVSDREPNERFTYGYRRLSALGALITGCVLIIGLGFVAWESIHRLFEPKPVRAGGMVALAVVGVLANGAAAWRLRSGKSLNEQVATWHLLEDTLGWVAVLVGGTIMAFWDVPIIDPLLSIGISIFVLYNVVRNLKKVGMVFLQASPAGFDVEAFRKEALELPKVVELHDTYTWTLDGERHVIATHLLMRAGTSREEICAAKGELYRLLRNREFEHITIETELEGEHCNSEFPPSAHECDHH